MSMTITHIPEIPTPVTSTPSSVLPSYKLNDGEVLHYQLSVKIAKKKKLDELILKTYEAAVPLIRNEMYTAIDKHNEAVAVIPLNRVLLDTKGFQAESVYLGVFDLIAKNYAPQFSLMGMDGEGRIQMRMNEL
jgi:hypothetical protein